MYIVFMDSTDGMAGAFVYVPTLTESKLSDLQLPDTFLVDLFRYKKNTSKDKFPLKILFDNEKLGFAERPIKSKPTYYDLYNVPNSTPNDDIFVPLIFNEMPISKEVTITAADFYDNTKDTGDFSTVSGVITDTISIRDPDYLSANLESIFKFFKKDIFSPTAIVPNVGLCQSLLLLDRNNPEFLKQYKSDVSSFFQQRRNADTIDEIPKFIKERVFMNCIMVIYLEEPNGEKHKHISLMGDFDSRLFNVAPPRIFTVGCAQINLNPKSITLKFEMFDAKPIRLDKRKDTLLNLNSTLTTSISNPDTGNSTKRFIDMANNIKDLIGAKLRDGQIIRDTNSVLFKKK